MQDMLLFLYDFITSIPSGQAIEIYGRLKVFVFSTSFFPDIPPIGTICATSGPVSCTHDAAHFKSSWLAAFTFSLTVHYARKDGMTEHRPS
jgi:hypothetical protein